MDVTLTPELENFVSGEVKSGRYNSASEVVQEALRLFEEHERTKIAQLAELNAEIGRRLALLDDGQRADPLEVRARLQDKSNARRQSSM